MQITFDQQKGISVVPSAGRRVARQFIDYETGYLVVAEVALDESADRSLFYTLADAQTGAVINPRTRAQQVDTAAHVTINREYNLKITTQRTFDPRTGQEQIIDTIVDLATGQEVMNKRSTAFSKTRRETALEAYVKRLGENNDMQRFWSEEYPKKTLDERKGYWLEYIYHDMRIMGEVGQDVFSILSKESYRDWKAKDPQIDRILDYVAEQLPRMWPGHDDTIRQKIRAMRS